MGSSDIRSAQRPVHREDVVAATRDVVAPPRRAQTADIRGLEGFRVDGPDGRIGTVTTASSSTPGEPPDTIQVMTGLFIVQVVPVAASEILQIDDDRSRILIRTMLRRPRTPHVRGMLRRFLASVGAQ